jgi:hypothetical protein
MLHQKAPCGPGGFWRDTRWIEHLQTGEPDEASILQGDVEPLVDGDDPPGPGRRPAIRLCARCGTYRQAGETKTQTNSSAQSRKMLAKAMRRAKIHDIAFARSRLVRLQRSRAQGRALV